MTTGREALHRIDAAIAEARRIMTDAQSTAAEEGRISAVLSASEIDVYRRLAELRIDLLKADSLEASLGAADRKARALIGDHDAHVAALAKKRDDAGARLAELEAARRRAEDDHDGATSAHDAAAAATRARIEADPVYDRLAKALEEADAIAKRAEQKLAVAREDRAEKGAAYEADPLFMYLRGRAYGTRAYRAFPLFSLLDGAVARLVRYRDARPNYERLLDIPERLSEHLERVREGAAEKAAAIEAFEREALEKDGVAALRDAAAGAARRLEEIDAAINAQEETLKSVAADYAAAAGGKSGPIDIAHQVLAEAFGARSIPDLRTLALETAAPEDDALIDELVRLRRERMEHEEAQKENARAAERRARSAGQLEDLRRRFKRARYDSPYSEFPAGNIIGAVLGELIADALDLDDAWKRIARSQRTRKRDWDDDFGGREWRGGLGYPERGRSNGGGRAPSVPHIPRAPRLPGGFKTGGGFGRGGGFKTGGGF